jgi:hypothetical protein
MPQKTKAKTGGQPEPKKTASYLYDKETGEREQVVIKKNRRRIL